MHKYLLYSVTIISILVSCISYADDDCKDKYRHLGARYLVTSSMAAQDNNKAVELAFQLWRKGSEILHIEPSKNLTTQWHKLINDEVRKVSYFDHYQRGIEFEPVKSSTNGWMQKYQLISNELLSKMALQTTEGHGCELIEHYQLKNAHVTLDVWWQPAINIAQKIIRKEHEHQTIWQLKDITYADETVKSVFAKVQDYQTTDYADIGDNESDPFLRKMINLGFIEHGGSGFYDANGNMLPGAHQH